LYTAPKNKRVTRRRLPIADVTVGYRSFCCWCKAPGSRTLYPRTLHLRRLYWCFDENWRRICFGILIRTLYCFSLFCLLRPVVLELIT